MKLYFSQGACSLAIRILIYELNLPCSFEAVDLKTKRTETGADYIEINAKGAVPALLLDDGELLTENAAIQQYLADTQQAFNLLPAIGDFKRYRVLEWLNFVSTELHKGCAPLFNANIPDEIKENIFRPILKSKLIKLNGHLAAQNYLLGSDYTLPDIYLFVVLRWLPHLGIALSGYPVLIKYLDHLKQRPAIQKSLTEENLQQ